MNFHLQRTLLLLLFLSGSIRLEAQNLAAYNDYRNYFIVFDNGSFLQQDFLPANSFKVGWNTVLFIDDKNVLRAYYNNRTYELADAWNASFDVSRNLAVYRLNNIVKVFDHGKVTDLSYYIGSYSLQDNLVAFDDDNHLALKVYQNGEITEVETTQLSKVQNFKAGSNLIAYINGIGRFRVYYEGEKSDLAPTAPVSYDVAKDVVAFIDYSTGYFKSFINGKLFKLDEFAPLSYKCGDNMVAYIDKDENFRIVANRSIKRLEAGKPDFYTIKDKIMAYFFNNSFVAFTNGQKYVLENYQPTSYYIDGNKLAYVSQNGYLKLFSDGITKIVTIEPAKEITLYGNVLTFKDVTGNVKIYFNDTLY